MSTSTNNLDDLGKTLLLLCCGYFVDFYDLTIFAANYHNIICDLFHIHNQTQIQQTFLKITNYYTAGIVLGGLFFGVLGDKIGRSKVIRYSILLYSLSILFSVFTHSIIVFTVLRFISGFGLATEFATSSVLISELFANKKRPLAVLYASGIMGGVCATFIGIFSWQVMFIFGGISGFILFLLRKNILESYQFLALKTGADNGYFPALFANFKLIKQFFALFCIILPFYFTISIMLIFPSIMPLTTSLASSVSRLLLGFFVGNLFSIVAYNLNGITAKHNRLILLINTSVFLLLLLIFRFIHDDYFILYCMMVGFMCGGLPVIWVELVASNYPTQIRNTATNTLYIVSRGSAILFNYLLVKWLALGVQGFIINSAIFAGIVALLAFIGIVAIV